MEQMKDRELEVKSRGNGINPAGGGGGAAVFFLSTTSSVLARGLQLLLNTMILTQNFRKSGSVSRYDRRNCQLRCPSRLG